MSVSVDGYMAGSNHSHENPLGGTTFHSPPTGPSRPLGQAMTAAGLNDVLIAGGDSAGLRPAVGSTAAETPRDANCQPPEEPGVEAGAVASAS